LKKTTISYYLKKSLPVIIVALVLLIIEFAGFNRAFTISAMTDLPTAVLEINDGVLDNFEYQDNFLISEGSDPKIQYRDLNMKIRGVDINCEPTTDRNSSQIFFATIDRPVSEDNSIRISLTKDDNVFFLPTTLFVTNLRFDLATDAGETLVCTDIVLNPEIEYQSNSLRILIYFLVLFLATMVSLKFSQQQLDAWFNHWGGWIIILFGLVIVSVDLCYPLVYTYDSGHYLWLSELIENNEFANWDIIRNLIFPLHLFLSKRLFTNSNIGLKIPMIIYHLGLYFSLFFLLKTAAEIKKGWKQVALALVIGVFIILDPTVIGYYHAVLTEYMAATLAALACLLAFTLYKSPWYSKSFWVANILLVLISIVGWHIKQPFLGIGLYPFLIGYLLKLLKKSEYKAWLVAGGVTIIIIGLLFSSTVAWEVFLSGRGNPLDVNRQFSAWLVNQISDQSEEATTRDNNIVKHMIKKYLTSSNFFYLDRAEMSMINAPSLIRAAQNGQIAHNIYSVGKSNMVASAYFEEVLKPYDEVSQPPEAINNLMLSRIKFSNFLFTIGYLTLPFLLIIYLFWWIRKKDTLSATCLILAGTAGLNALVHTIGAAPLDRYFFWGYPLIMAAWICGLIAAFRSVNREKPSSGKIEAQTTKD